jgi:hypothetical protein
MATQEPASRQFRLEEIAATAPESTLAQAQELLLEYGRFVVAQPGAARFCFGSLEKEAARLPQLPRAGRRLPDGPCERRAEGIHRLARTALDYRSRRLGIEASVGAPSLNRFLIQGWEATKIRLNRKQ